MLIIELKREYKDLYKYFNLTNIKVRGVYELLF
jgi:hypothetical protein